MLDDSRLANFIDELRCVDVLHGLVPKWIGAVIKIVRKSFYLWWRVVSKVALTVPIFVVADAFDLELYGCNLLGLLLLNVSVRGFPSYCASHQVVGVLIKLAIDGVSRSRWVLGLDFSLE